ncbi:MAG: extracellular solute-binding protein [Sphaerochaetaceae bacterium]|nr:extracellular solute-binding protein [Sphaerochaetaceae bacterium]
MATIKDVAKLAGVSIASVSNYLNHPNLVGSANAAKIKNAISTLGYKQNAMAKNLKSKRSNDIGIILPNFDDSYYAQIYQGIESVFQQSDFYLNLAFSYDNKEREEMILDGFLKKQICGLILISSKTDSWKFYYDSYISKNKPMVLLDRQIDNLDANIIYFDNKETISFLTKTLIEKNLKNIVLITGPQAFQCESMCIEGFSETMKKSNIPLNPDTQIVSSGSSKEDSFKSTVELFKKTVPEAIITTSENRAIGIIECMELLGYSIKDIPVLTLGEDHWNRHTHSIATLSTIRPAIHMGELAANILINQIDTPIINENKHIVLKDKILQEERQEHPFLKKTIKPHAKCEDKGIRILLLDTMQVHALTGLMNNFYNMYGINTTIEIVSHHQLYQKILDDRKNAEKGKAFDVFMFDIPWLYTLANSEILADISEYINKPSFDTSLFLPDSLDYFSKYDDNYYGLPFMYAPQILYYRKDLFNDPLLKQEFEQIFHSQLRPPRTWKEFNAISEFFSFYTEKIPYGTSIPAAFPESLAPEIYLRIFSAGGSVFDQNNKVILNKPKNLKAYIDLLKIFKFAKPNFRQTDDIGVVNDFLNGETAMVITYPSFINESVNGHAQKKIMSNIGFAQIPGQSPILGGWSLGINQLSDHKDEAFKFLSWACTDQISNHLSLLGGFSAVESTYSNDELIKLYPWFPIYHSAHKNSRPIVPPRKENGDIVSQNMIDEIVCKGIYSLIEEDKEIPSVIEETQQELEKLLLNQ